MAGAKGGRCAIKITKEQLERILLDKSFDPDSSNNNHIWVGNVKEKCPKLTKDLEKVIFDDENTTCDQDGFMGDAKLCGFHTLDNGLTFLGVLEGGDWEYPVFFIIYYDGKELRGYIPEDGNMYNKVFKTAFGSEGEYGPEIEQITPAMVNNIKEMFPNLDQDELDELDELVKRYNNGKKNQIFGCLDITEFCMGHAESIGFDWDKIEADIKNRIVVK
jgi:hypothetical protein